MAHDVLARRRNARAISFPPTCFYPRDAVPPGYALAVGRLEGSRASNVAYSIAPSVLRRSQLASPRRR
jgi:hypothetical protein